MKKKPAAAPASIDAYIASFPPDVQKSLKKIRSLIRKAAPHAEEAIKYQMPSYVLHGHLIFFAAYKNHIAIYPRTKGMDAVGSEIARYESGQGTLKFPLSEPIPFALIGRLAAIRVKESSNGSPARPRTAPKPKLESKPAAKAPATKRKTAKKSAKSAARKRTKLPRR